LNNRQIFVAFFALFVIAANALAAQSPQLSA
jgi:hypothetical protein